LLLAKEALKETVILPVRFPHLFTGECVWSDASMYILLGVTVVAFVPIINLNPLQARESHGEEFYFME